MANELEQLGTTHSCTTVSIKIITTIRFTVSFNDDDDFIFRVLKNVFLFTFKTTYA